MTLQEQMLAWLLTWHGSHCVRCHAPVDGGKVAWCPACHAIVRRELHRRMSQPFGRISVCYANVPGFSHGRGQGRAHLVSTSEATL